MKESSLSLISLLAPHTSDALRIVQKTVADYSEKTVYHTKVLAVVESLATADEYRHLSIHLCGDSRAGKTTLRRSLGHCIRNILGSFMLPRTSVGDPEKLESTIGLEKESISNYFGKDEYVLFDYGGQDEYHVNHRSHLSSGAGSVYVVVVGLAAVDGDNRIHKRGREDREECKKLVDRYKYWLRFINSVAARGSLVFTVLNFKSAASFAFCNTVKNEIMRLFPDKTETRRPLRNLVFWEDIIVTDLLTTREVYSSSLFKTIKTVLSEQSMSIVSSGVLAVRQYKKDEQWPKVLPMEYLQEDYLLEALLNLKEMKAAKGTLSSGEWNSLKEFILSEITSGLLSCGDILEVNGFVVTDFNWFTSEVLGKLFRTRWCNIQQLANNLFSFALSSRDIEALTGVDRHHFGEDVHALPQLLEQLQVCRQINEADSCVDDGDEQFWFPAFLPIPRPPDVELGMIDAVRVVRRRFYLNEDFMFPPGYFADLYLKITTLDPRNHQFVFWEDCMKFESRYLVDNKDFVVGVYISIGSTGYFDVVVCSTELRDLDVTGRVIGHSNPCRVWNWMCRVRGFVYSLYSEENSLVREWCLDPVSDSDEERTIQDVLLGKQEKGDVVCQRYYYGSCGGHTVAVVMTDEEYEVLSTMLRRRLVSLGREYDLHSVERNNPARHQLENVLNQVRSLKFNLKRLEGNMSPKELEELSTRLLEASSNVDALETAMNGMIQENQT